MEKLNRVAMDIVGTRFLFGFCTQTSAFIDYIQLAHNTLQNPSSVANIIFMLCTEIM